MKKTHTIIVDTNKITFPDDTEQTTKAVRSATLVVAANDSEVKSKAQADYVCDGTDDHLEIQAAIDALPATGGEVFLLEGTYNVQSSIVLDSYQTLRGCGRNTILTTTTANLDFLTATGGAGTEKVGILIADLYIDGNNTAQTGVYFVYVDYSKIENVWFQDCTAWAGIIFDHSDFNKMIGNIIDSSAEGFELDTSNSNIIEGNHISGGLNGPVITYSSNNTIIGNIIQGVTQFGMAISPDCDNNSITGNIIQGCGYCGIILTNSDNNTISGNTCQGNVQEGIKVNAGADNNTISGNTCADNGTGATKYSGIIIGSGAYENVITGNQCEGNGLHGIEIYRTNYCTIVGNVCNNQETGDGINITGDATGNADYNNIIGNTCYNNASHGIEIAGGVDANYNAVKDNVLQGNTTAPFADAGTNTMLAAYVVPFSHGSDPQDGGFEIDVDAEFARAWLRLPPEVQQVVRMKIYARAVILSAAAMRLEINVNGGADNEPFNTHPTAAPDTPSTSTNFAADDVIFWTLVSAQIIALLGGDSVEVKVLHEAAGGGDVVTDAFFRTVEFEYV